MIEHSTEEFFMTSSGGGGGSGLPSSQRHDTGALSAPVATTVRLEDTLATQAMMTVPPWVLDWTWAFVLDGFSTTIDGRQIW
jgi:hypothetical protein